MAFLSVHNKRFLHSFRDPLPLGGEKHTKTNKERGRKVEKRLKKRKEVKEKRVRVVTTKGQGTYTYTYFSG